MTRAPAVVRVAITSQLRARRFYERVLQLPPAPDSPAGRMRFWADGRLIELHARARPGERSKKVTHRQTRIVLRVEDFSYEYQRLSSAGVSFVGAVELVAGAWRARVSDPDGNIYTVIEAVKPVS